jgi:hypothetical protein
VHLKLGVNNGLSKVVVTQEDLDYAMQQVWSTAWNLAFLLACVHQSGP